MRSLYRQLRSLFHRALYAPSVKAVLTGIGGIRQLYPPWERKHPIDVAYRIQTSGSVPVKAIHPDRRLTALIHPYCPSQPSIVRQALTALGDLRNYAFADLGCGKGRVTVVASEFPFREIIGIELSSDLVLVARANASEVERQFPERRKIQVCEANVLDFLYPDGSLVVFTYHSFGREIFFGLIQKLEARLSSGLDHLFFVYYNPVHGDVLDTSPLFKRWYAERLNCEDKELEFGPDAHDSVVIWQSIGGESESPHERAERAIIVHSPLRADVEK